MYLVLRTLARVTRRTERKLAVSSVSHPINIFSQHNKQPILSTKKIEVQCRPYSLRSIKSCHPERNRDSIFVSKAKFFRANFSTVIPNRPYAFLESERPNVSVVQDDFGKPVQEFTNIDMANWMQKQGYDESAVQFVRSTKDMDGILLSTNQKGFLSLLPKATALKMEASNLIKALTAPAEIRDLITDAAITEEIKASLDYLEETMALSSEKGLAWQQENICRFILKPLPLGTNSSRLDPRIWNSFYFDDLYQHKPRQFNEVEAAIKSSTNSANEQDHRLLHLVQMSGAGKTHFTLSYARNKGGIVLRNVPEANRALFDAASKAIETRLHKHKTSADCYKLAGEVNFLESSRRVMMLISLTAMELAEKFYATANETFPDDKLKHQAYLRFISNGGGELLVKMFRRNVLLVDEETAWQTYTKKCVEFVKSVGITAIFLDEIHLLQAKLGGEFIHFSYKEKVRPSLISRLQAERNSVPDGELPLKKVFKRRTSLLYVMVLAMETFATVHKLAHVSSSTSYSAMKYFGETHSRGRLPIRSIIYNDDVESRFARFKQLLEETFGVEQATKAIQTHYKTLRALASRALYLWYFFNDVHEVEKDESFEDFFHKQITSCVLNAKEKAEEYYEKIAASGESIVVKVIAQVAFGGEEVEVEPEDFAKMVDDKMVEVGLIHLSEDGNNQQVSLATDFYLRQHIISLSFKNIMKAWHNAQRGQLARTQGYNGELGVMALVRWHQGKTFQDFYTASAHLSTTLLHIPKKIARLKFSSLITPIRPHSELLAPSWEGEFFLDIDNYKNYALFPSEAMGPDVVTFLLDREGNPAAYLLIQSKNHQDTISAEQKLTKAVGVCNTVNFYRHPNQVENKAKWEQIRHQVKPLPWIRVVFAQSFNNPTIAKVAKYNETYPDQPIILLPSQKLAVLQISSRAMLDSFGIDAQQQQAKARKTNKTFSVADIACLRDDYKFKTEKVTETSEGASDKL